MVTTINYRGKVAGNPQVTAPTVNDDGHTPEACDRPEVANGISSSQESVLGDVEEHRLAENENGNLPASTPDADHPQQPDDSAPQLLLVSQVT